jgi:hypothetical protein
MSSDTIVREVDEELRRDRLRKLWRHGGPYVIGAAVLVVLAVAAYEGWTWWQKTQASKSSDQFYAAIAAVNGTDKAAGKKALDDVIAQGSGGYPMLAQFREAALLAQTGKTDDAVAAYDALASAQTNPHLRELALVLGANLLIEKGDVAGVQQRVSGLLTPDSPMRNAAREALGLAQFKAGKLDDAMTTFQSIMDDPLAARDAQSRIQLYMQELEAQGAKAPVPANPSAPADASSTAAPVASDVSSVSAAASTVSSVAPAVSSAVSAASSEAPVASASSEAAPSAVSSEAAPSSAAASSAPVVSSSAP